MSVTPPLRLQMFVVGGLVLAMLLFGVYANSATSDQLHTLVAQEAVLRKVRSVGVLHGVFLCVMLRIQHLFRQFMCSTAAAPRRRVPRAALQPLDWRRENTVFCAEAAPGVL